LQHVKGSDVKSKSAASAAPARQKIGDELACTDSVRAIDLLLDPRQSVAKMEQLAAYS
jgi:hypothetical protein